ncbi:MAG TPA: helix-turn-helix transcriptional regulator, partial [Polyangiales bacterium]|nr:helix-turn-helix transcriptional regulator [Polyangiales bacterium]
VRLVLLDTSLGILYGEPEGLQLLAHALGEAASHPSELSLSKIEDEIRQARQSKGDRDACVITVGRVCIRALAIGGKADGSTCLLIWPLSQREPLRSAAVRFRLSSREVEVLRCMLDGMSATEIAASLSIREGTVNDHFTHLLRKTSAKNRAEMIAKVLDYVPSQS